MAREVQIGSGHAFVKGSGEFQHTQSGLFELGILCARCDNHLGALENAALKTFRAIRTRSTAHAPGTYALGGHSGTAILRFVAGVLWKYAAARKSNGRIRLGPYLQTIEGIAFRDDPIPSSFDGVLIRLKRYDADEGVFAYRAPRSDRQEGVNGFRLLVGGVFIFAKLDKRLPKSGALERAPLNRGGDLQYFVMPAQAFEEFTIGKRLANMGKLSDYLDRRERE